MSYGSWDLHLPGGSGVCMVDGSVEPPHQYRYEWRWATHDCTHHRQRRLVGICIRCGKHRAGVLEPDWKNPWDILACVHCWDWIFPPTHWAMWEWKPATYYHPELLDFTDPIAACRERGMPESIISQHQEIITVGNKERISIIEGGTPPHCPNHSDLEKAVGQMDTHNLGFIGGLVHKQCAAVCPQMTVRPLFTV